MSDKFFLDTNIFVYTFDHRDKAKNKKSMDLVGEALEDHSGVISYQVVQEFMNTALKKFMSPMSLDDLQAYLKGVLLPLCEVYSSADLFRQTLYLQEKSGFSFYDALMIASAHEAECRVLYSEDLQHGRSIEGVRILNPFK